MLVATRKLWAVLLAPQALLYAWLTRFVHGLSIKITLLSLSSFMALTAIGMLWEGLPEERSDEEVS